MLFDVASELKRCEHSCCSTTPLLDIAAQTGMLAPLWPGMMIVACFPNICRLFSSIEASLINVNHLMWGLTAFKLHKSLK